MVCQSCLSELMHYKIHSVKPTRKVSGNVVCVCIQEEVQDINFLGTMRSVPVHKGKG